MQTLILGARGQLGRDLMALFSTTGTVAGYDLPEIDVANAAHVNALVNEFKPGLLINAAAYTDVEKAEDERDIAFRVNEQGARCASEAAASVGAPVVYYSTDFVFGGRKTTPYVPDDVLDPHGAYAESKAAGETATRGANPKHFIIRTAWLYGPGGNNFVEKILRAAASRPCLKVVDDEVGSPTHTLDLAEATAALCATNSFGTYHAVNAGSCSRFEFAKTILAYADMKTLVEPCSSADFPTKAPRPTYSVLSSEALAAISGYHMRPWQDALKDYITRRRIKG